MTRRLRNRVAHVLVAVAGLLVFAYPLTLGASPDVSCRGATMHPGEVCLKADGKGTQSYEQRAQDARNARPIILVVGLLVAGFGVTLLVSDVRGERRPVRP